MGKVQMKIISLTNSNKVVFVDDEDYLYLELLGPWCLNSGYAKMSRYSRQYAPNSK
jgi:hypothetical protein